MSARVECSFSDISGSQRTVCSYSAGSSSCFLFVPQIGRSRAGGEARAVDTEIEHAILGQGLPRNTNKLAGWLTRELFNFSLPDSKYHVVGLVLA